MPLQTPPAQKKEAIDKCVEYVIKNGPSFAQKLLSSKDKAQFSFLSEGGEFHDYYTQQLELKSKPEREPATQATSTSPVQKAPQRLPFLTELPPISFQDLQMVKAVALYAASNSDQALRRFREHSKKLPNRQQFAFLDDSHSLNALLRSYIEQYRILANEAKQMGTKEASLVNGAFYSQSELFQSAHRRAAHLKQERMQRKRKELDEQRKQYLYASIDWQDFQMVATVQFDSIDEVSELARPILRAAVAARLLASKNQGLELEYGGGREKEGEEKEKQTLGENQEKPKEGETIEKGEMEGGGGNGTFKGMKIRAAGESRLKRKKAASERTITCPLTAQPIPESQFDTHLKILLRDPKYKEQQENYMKKNFRYESNLTSDQVFENIKDLVRKQTFSEEEESHKRRALDREI